MGGTALVFLTSQVAEISAEDACPAGGECDLAGIAVLFWMVLAFLLLLGGIAINELTLPRGARK